MSVESILRLGRARRESLMQSTCRISRPAGEPVFDPDTGSYTAPGTTVIYEGKCQLKPTFSPAEREGSSGQREVALNAYDLVLPWDAANLVGPVQIEDTAEILSGDDAWAIGKQFPVGWVEQSDTRTHRRVTIWAQDRGGVTHA